GLPAVLTLTQSRHLNPAITSVGDLLCTDFFVTCFPEDQELLLRLVDYLRSPSSAFRRVKAHPTRLTHYSGAPVEHSPRLTHALPATRGRGSSARGGSASSSPRPSPEHRRQPDGGSHRSSRSHSGSSGRQTKRQVGEVGVHSGVERSSAGSVSSVVLPLEEGLDATPSPPAASLAFRFAQ
ncbi:unnamed protein product, partial [Pylaiella littoralis]